MQPAASSGAGAGSACAARTVLAIPRRTIRWKATSGSTDPNDPDYSWSHIGMDVHEARRLNHSTLDLTRRKNDRAVLRLWQAEYQHLLLPQLGREENIRIEKAVERIAMTPRDFPNSLEGVRYIDDQLDVLRRHGVRLRAPGEELTDRPLFHETHR